MIYTAVLAACAAVGLLWAGLWLAEAIPRAIDRVARALDTAHDLTEDTDA